jgi:RNA polymerase sigma-70 factor (ECF subfamily)
LKRKVLDSKSIHFHLFKKGDEKAFAFFFNLYYNQIVGFCTEFIKDRDKAKSITQEAFLKLWLNKEKVQKINGIKAFLYTSAKSDCLNLFRHKKVVHKYFDNSLRKREESLNVEVLNAMNFDTVMLTELEELIEGSVNELPDKCKQVFKMRRIEFKKNKEIAAELNISIKAVEANMTRALKHLKNKLSDYLPAMILLIVFHCF